MDAGADNPADDPGARRVRAAKGPPVERPCAPAVCYSALCTRICWPGKIRSGLGMAFSVAKRR